MVGNSLSRSAPATKILLEKNVFFVTLLFFLHILLSRDSSLYMHFDKENLAIYMLIAVAQRKVPPGLKTRDLPLDHRGALTP